MICFNNWDDQKLVSDPESSQQHSILKQFSKYPSKTFTDLHTLQPLHSSWDSFCFSHNPEVYISSFYILQALRITGEAHSWKNTLWFHAWEKPQMHQNNSMHPSHLKKKRGKEKFQWQPSFPCRHQAISTVSKFKECLITFRGNGMKALPLQKKRSGHVL